eukprot:TRINITY_DN3192_c0_g1_i2.p1 TRINITY_DN3192_c0_g1~~TRINITY_DN3192_c0_g1_i2.p1  ORF type:complete len:350 (-),score=85.60 TRINITY_DN3192_c0_g1_i2:356-1405(-)
MGQTNSHHPRDQSLNHSKKKPRSTTVSSGKAGGLSSSSSTSSSSFQNDRRLTRSNTAPSIPSTQPTTTTNNNNTKTLHKPKPSSPRPGLSRNTSAYPPRSNDESTKEKATPGGGKNKVMKENELITHLEQMGFAKSVILECLEGFDVQKGKRTVIDPNALIEQLIIKTRRSIGTDVATSSSIDPSTFFEGLTSSSSSTSINNNNNNDNENNNSSDHFDSNTNQATNAELESVFTPPTYINPFKQLALIENGDEPTQMASAPSSSTTISENKIDYVNPFAPPTLNPFYEREISSPGDYDSTKCKICFDAPVETVILKCAHSVMCMDCSKGLKKCPICFRDISQVIRIYTC